MYFNVTTNEAVGQLAEQFDRADGLEDYWESGEREHQHLEFKIPSGYFRFGWKFANSDISIASKAICAFSNAEGGVLLFGILDKDRTVDGVLHSAGPIPGKKNVVEKFCEKLQSRLPEYLWPNNKIEVRALPSYCPRYAAVIVPAGKDFPYCDRKSGAFYIRRHDRSIPMEPWEILRLLAIPKHGRLAFAAEIKKVSATSPTFDMDLWVRNIGLSQINTAQVEIDLCGARFTSGKNMWVLDHPYYHWHESEFPRSYDDMASGRRDRSSGAIYAKFEILKGSNLESEFLSQANKDGYLESLRVVRHQSRFVPLYPHLSSLPGTAVNLGKVRIGIIGREDVEYPCRIRIMSDGASTHETEIHLKDGLRFWCVDGVQSETHVDDFIAGTNFEVVLRHL